MITPAQRAELIRLEREVADARADFAVGDFKANTRRLETAAQEFYSYLDTLTDWATDPVREDG